MLRVPVFLGDLVDVRAPDQHGCGVREHVEPAERVVGPPEQRFVASEITNVDLLGEMRAALEPLDERTSRSSVQISRADACAGCSKR